MRLFYPFQEADGLYGDLFVKLEDEQDVIIVTLLKMQDVEDWTHKMSILAVCPGYMQEY